MKILLYNKSSIIQKPIQLGNITIDQTLIPPFPSPHQLCLPKNKRTNVEGFPRLGAFNPYRGRAHLKTGHTELFTWYIIDGNLHGAIVLKYNHLLKLLGMNVLTTCIKLYFGSEIPLFQSNCYCTLLRHI